MDSLASLALATEAPTDAVLDLPPYSPSQPLLTPSVRRPPPPDPVIPYLIEPRSLRSRTLDLKPCACAPSTPEPLLCTTMQILHRCNLASLSTYEHVATHKGGRGSCTVDGSRTLMLRLRGARC